MSINASIPNYDPSNSNKPFYRRLFSKKQEITLTDTGLVSEKKRASVTDKSGASVSRKAFKVMGEVYSNPPKKGLFERNKIVINIKVEGKPLYAKVNKKAFEKPFDIKSKDLGKKTVEENTHLIKDRILHKRYELALKENDSKEIKSIAKLGSHEAAFKRAEDYFKDNGQFGSLIEDKKKKAIKLLERAASLGSTQAMLKLADLSNDKNLRLAWSQAAADHGSFQGMERAALYYQSRGMINKSESIVNSDLNKALHYWNRYVESAPKYDVTSLPYENMGKIHNKLHNKDEAIRSYEKAASLSKRHWVEVGNLYLEKGLNIAREIPGAKDLSQDDLILMAIEQNNQRALTAFLKAQKAYIKADSPEGKIGIASIILSYFPKLGKAEREKLKIQLGAILKPIAEKKSSGRLLDQLDKEMSEKARALLNRLSDLKTV